MGYPSEQASNAIMYTTYSVFLIFGLFVSWRYSKSKGDFMSSLRTQTWPYLALNFAASAMGSGILFTYPQIATIAGVQGVLTYAFSSSLPLLTFPVLAPKIRKLCPHGFILTEFVRERFGTPAALFLSFFSVVTMFIYMVSELTSVTGVINSLTDLNAIPATVVEVVVTLLYTAWGGFRTSLITDNVQGVMILLLLVICSVAMGVNIRIDTSTIWESGYLNASLLGWQLLYILPVAIVTNNFFLSGYWQRAFSSKTDKDLRWGCGAASSIVFVILTLVGFSGLLAAWAGLYPAYEGDDGSFTFFQILETLPTWVVGFVIVFALSLSCAAYDTLQAAIVVTLSNDVFRNRINIWWVRLILVVNVPAIVVATKKINILVLYLISDLVSAALIPPIFLGLVPQLYFLSGIDIIVGGLGGFFTVFIFGSIYYNDAAKGAGVLILQNGLYSNDWSTFGAFLVAPIGGLLWTFGFFALRAGATYLYARRTGRPYTVFERKVIDTRNFADEAVRAAITLPEDEERRSSAEEEQEDGKKAAVVEREPESVGRTH